jgi:hypothetical protein
VWCKRKLDLRGLAFFRGGLAPSLAGLYGLEKAGIDVETLPPGSEEVWAANLRHRVWGNARLSALRNAQLPPEILVKTASGLTERERETIVRDAQSTLALEVPAQTGDVLRDRKQFLRFMAAVLGTDGVAGLDLTGQLFWTPDRLADETTHDAALDIVHVMSCTL